MGLVHVSVANVDETVGFYRDRLGMDVMAKLGDQASFLFLYNPIQLYAVNKAVTFVPYVNQLNLAETGVTEQHWSVRKQEAAVQE